MGGELASFIKIDGDIKRQFSPFVLSAEDPQIFSFKKPEQDGKINICPKSIEQYITNDISYQSIIKPYTSADIDINTLFNSIPSLQIREFLPDTRLEQALNFFNKIIETMTSVTKAVADEKEKAKNEKKPEPNIFERIKSVATTAIDFLTGQSEKNLYTALSAEFFEESNNRLKAFSNLSNNKQKYVLTFPYTLWYLMQSSRTNNIYEIPCLTDNKELYNANGQAGWNTPAGFSLVGMLPGGGGNGFAGKAINALLGNVNVSFMPWWNAKEGNATPFTDVKIKIDLYNDTLKSAIQNFIFINTLIPNAKWIQYNIFQHSSSIYDIKIDGYKRLYACSGSFNVKYGGILRDPTQKFFKDLKKYINNDAMDVENFILLLEKNKLIKIPDVYKVEMSFKSLLPDNFNNHIYMYSSNNIIVDDAKTQRTESSVFNAIANAMGEFGKTLVDAWKNPKNEEKQNENK